MPIRPYSRFFAAGSRSGSFLTFLLIFLLQGCSMPACSQLRVAQAGSAAPSHAAWDVLLKKWVDERGMVDYKGFSEDRKALRAYLQQLEANAPDPERWSGDEQLAYWINAYNAFTIELILRHYPLQSIKDIKGGPQIPFVNTPWDIKFIRIGGRELDLNNIEHNIIRPGFEEPRIHFALVCAARSCPKLRREAYVADRLEAQLADQARSFLLDPDKNIVRSDRLQLSKLFDWYGGDFTKDRSLQEAIADYSGVPVSQDAPVSYLYYNWQLNEQ